MDESLRSFLEQSPLAEKVRLASRVVLHRTALSIREILAIRQRGGYGPVPGRSAGCELVAGGQVLARGRIVRRRGKCWFQVLEGAAGRPAGKERAE
jgi:hypothetical protein